MTLRSLGPTGAGLARAFRLNAGGPGSTGVRRVEDCVGTVEGRVAYRDLRDFVKALEKAGELKRVQGEDGVIRFEG